LHTDHILTVKPSEAFLAARHVPWQLGWFTHPAKFSLVEETSTDEKMVAQANFTLTFR